jgi:hypothetical protein
MRKTPTNSANIGGLQNEDIFATLKRIFERKGYLTHTQKWVDAKESPIFSSGDRLRLDFYFEGKPVAPKGFAISAKYQEVEGTTDSKVYYEVDYLIKRCIPMPCALVIRGEYWLSHSRARARRWILAQKDNKHLKEVFFSVDDLYKWASGLPDCTGFDSNGSPGRAIPLPIPPMEQTELF